jgi:pimeloyl-ACP methyl ester carboxylesterase
MATPYEIAYLCGHAYRPDHQVRPMNEVMHIPGGGKWGIEFHNGISNNFFCTKYIQVDTGQDVIAFRGTGARLADILVDIRHLFSRSSHYVMKAKDFYHKHHTRNTIVTGHSLGGFLAIAMAYHFSTKAIAINPPWVSGLPEVVPTPAGAIGQAAQAVDQLQAKMSQAFASSRLLVYYSNTDVVNALTRAGKFSSPNMQFIPLGSVGFHSLDPIINEFRRTRQYEINWNF